MRDGTQSDHIATLESVFTDLLGHAEAGAWEEMSRVAERHDELLREALRAPSQQMLRYLNSLKPRYEKLALDTAQAHASLRDETTTTIKGRRAVAAYR